MDKYVRFSFICTAVLKENGICARYHSKHKESAKTACKKEKYEGLEKKARVRTECPTPLSVPVHCKQVTCCLFVGQ
jgi:hypothetical protein